MVVVLLATHGALGSLYATQPVHPEAGRFPGEDEFLSTPDRYLGDRVIVGGFVTSSTPLVLRVDGPDGPARVTITDGGLSPDTGDKVRVFGVLTESTTVRAIGAFVVPRSGLWYAWSVSVLAGLWVCVRLVRHWTVDVSTLAVRPRERPSSLTRLLYGGERDG